MMKVSAVCVLLSVLIVASGALLSVAVTTMAVMLADVLCTLSIDAASFSMRARFPLSRGVLKSPQSSQANAEHLWHLVCTGAQEGHRHLGAPAPGPARPEEHLHPRRGDFKPAPAPGPNSLRHHEQHPWAPAPGPEGWWHHHDDASWADLLFILSADKVRVKGVHICLPMTVYAGPDKLAKEAEALLVLFPVHGTKPI